MDPFFCPPFFCPYGAPHEGFPVNVPDTWWEDRNQQGRPYGHRSNEPKGFDRYQLDKTSEFPKNTDQKRGCFYIGQDMPTAPYPIGDDKANWYFRLKVVDVCAGKIVATTEFITIDWANSPDGLWRPNFDNSGVE